MKSESYQCVKPVSPVAPYIGGKRLLSKRICAKIEETQHITYAEPFVGMGGVFLRRTSRARAEVINDGNGEVANFFRVLQRHYPFFIDMLRFALTSRREFERLVATDPKTLTDLERAARFLYLQRTAFGGKVSGQSFGVSAQSPGRFDVTKLGPMLDDLHDRLSGVVIENLGWSAFIERYDNKDTLFYLDPPYYGCETDYGAGLFSRDMFYDIAEKLASIKGRFILSINDAPEVRRIFSAFNLEEVDVTYTIAGGSKAKKTGELIITR